MPPRKTSPDLTLPLAQPITLARGPRSHLVTLMDAAILIRDLEPFHRSRPVWDRAAEMIMLAGTTAADVQEATRQILVGSGTRIGCTIFPRGDRRNSCWVARTKPQSASPPLIGPSPSTGMAHGKWSTR